MAYGPQTHIRPAGQRCFPTAGPAKPRLKDAKEFRLVGKPVKRRDGEAIVSGSAVYGSYVKLPGMLHAVVARCPYLGGKTRSPAIRLRQ